MLELNVCGHTKRNRTSTGEKNKKTKNKRSEFLGSSLVVPFGRQSRGLRDREELSTVFSALVGMSFNDQRCSWFHINMSRFCCGNLWNQCF